MQDYNDPATPTSVFYQWQLSQQPDGQRESSSTAMLPQEVKERKNLVIKVQQGRAGRQWARATGRVSTHTHTHTVHV